MHMEGVLAQANSCWIKKNVEDTFTRVEVYNDRKVSWETCGDLDISVRLQLEDIGQKLRGMTRLSHQTTGT